MDDSGRQLLQAAGGLALAGAAAGFSGSAKAAGDDADTAVAKAFERLVAALKGGDLEGFYGSMHTDFVMIDEDSPYRMNKAEFQDHIGFHVSGLWERFEWLPLAAQAGAFGDSGSVVGTATFRGKPRDAGFRIRHLLFAQTWTRNRAGAWELLLWHQSPVDGHSIDVSPG